jgi:hypothetical protein
MKAVNMAMEYQISPSIRQKNSYTKYSFSLFLSLSHIHTRELDAFIPDCQPFGLNFNFHIPK